MCIRDRHSIAQTATWRSSGSRLGVQSASYGNAAGGLAALAMIARRTPKRLPGDPAEELYALRFAQDDGYLSRMSVLAGDDSFVGIVRIGLFYLAAATAAVCVVDWAVRTRRINPFGGIARFFRARVDPL